MSKSKSSNRKPATPATRAASRKKLADSGGALDMASLEAVTPKEFQASYPHRMKDMLERVNAGEQLFDIIVSIRDEEAAGSGTARASKIGPRPPSTSPTNDAPIRGVDDAPDMADSTPKP